jgi:putative ABC transport system permease protein
MLHQKLVTKSQFYCQTQHMKGVFKENIKIAFGSIKTQLLRTVLTVIIISFGIMALVGILASVSIIENSLNSSFTSMGSNTFTINQYGLRIRINGKNVGDKEQINPIISYPQAKAFKENYNFPFSYTSISFIASQTAEVKFENTKTDPEIQIVGVDDMYTINSGLEVSQGRNFTPSDIANNAFICVLGSDFVSKGLLKDVNPIDKIISVRGAKFKVIGVLKEKGSTFGNNQDLRILIPIQVARSLFSAPNINYTIRSMVTNKELLEPAIESATLAMRQVRKLNPVEDNNFGVVRSDDLANKLAGITDYLTIAAWVIGIITILGSSIALMNIMIVSVTERTREIGVRKSLGAKKSTIAWQFFVETLIISNIGGFFGILLGIGIGALFSSATDFAFVLPWKAIFAAVATSFVVALVSGLYPAIKASQLDPIEALRYE